MPARTVGDDRRRARLSTARGDVRSARASRRRADPPSAAALAIEAVEAIIPVSSSARRGSTTGALHRFRAPFRVSEDPEIARSDGESILARVWTRKTCILCGRSVSLPIMYVYFRDCLTCDPSDTGESLADAEVPAFQEIFRTSKISSVEGTSEAGPRRRVSQHRARPRVDLRSHQTDTAHTHGCRPEPALLV